MADFVGLLCARCGHALPLTKTGGLRRGKRFCSMRCQKASVAERRARAREELRQALQELEAMAVEASLVARIAKAVQTLGHLPRGRG